ncbi:scavenger receptor cysteine-rich type 1 protein M130-like [Perca fluviatilis]|uniref:scavenger receptor cysteine-rich type 1 protein M130-like n=1 Tax=Perca fluviatilis TaxID=8168 RepID=UPI001962D5E3|nr:scavenger receptor cysteine-rich type 1 protein M130-like [Perca fluviatilis]
MDPLLMVLLLLWRSGLWAEGRHNSTGSQECETAAKADIVLLVDESGSISPSEFETMKTFLAGMVSNFNIGPDRVQIGLVQYSDNPRTEWHLNTHQTKYSLLKAIANPVQLGGLTYTGKALNYILQNNFKPNVGMRPDSKKIAVLITDGEANDNTLLPSQKLKDAGIEIYTIGVKDADHDQLRYIASDPEEIHTYSINHFSSLRHIVDDLTINICNSLVFVRLVNGTSLCSGRLEVKTNQSNQRWSSVCEDDFDQQDAEVVCRELGCGAPSVLQGVLYGEVEAPMKTKKFQCGGNESALLDCRSSVSDRNNCSSGKAVGLTCSDPVRLVGGSSRCTGTLEVKRGDWRTVDAFNWTLKEAAVVCEELDCGSAFSAGIRNESLPNSTWEISPDCINSGYTLRECVTSGSSSSIMKINCLEPVRLVGGSSHCAGTLEMKRGDWRPVDVSDWTLKEAALVCGALDCGSAVSTGIRNESLSKSAWKISPNCIHSGYTLRECATSGSSSSIMEITCLDSVRLVNGTSLCSGKLEVKTSQSTQRWSSVCEDDFDQQDAEVVCRELGCGAPSVLQGALYGDVEAPMWTKEFQCGGKESALLDCRSSDRNTCSSGKAVGLTCSDPVRLVGGWSRCTGTLEVKQGDWRSVDGSHQTPKESASVYCGKLSCSSPLSAGSRDDSSNRSAWKINSDCVQSGSALRECVTPSSSSSSVLELTCLHPAAVIIRLVVLPLTLLLSTIVIYFIMKVQATRRQMSGPQENIELDYYNLGFSKAEGAPAEEEGAQAAE